MNISTSLIQKATLVVASIVMAAQIGIFFKFSGLSSRVTDLEVLVGLAAPEPTNSVDAPKP